MIILKLGITNFGKLHGVSLSFDKGMNLIYGENESGKSTVHAFIRAMLFGLDRQRGRASKTDDYSKYEPWENPAVYEGTLTFQKGGAVYRIYRRFSRNDRKTEIVNETTGEVLTEEAYKELLDGLTESSFLNTVCIGQMKAAPGQSFTQELQNRLVNYLSVGEPEWDMNRAFAFLAEEKKKLMKDYQPQLEEELRLAEADLAAAEEALAQQTMCKEEAQEELEQMRAYTAKGRQEYENSEKLRRLRYLGLGISVASLLLMIGCYVMNFLQEGGWKFAVPVFGILALVSGFLAWKGFSLTSVSMAFAEAERKEKALAEQIQRVEWKLEQMRERSALYESALEGFKQQVEENRRIYGQISALILAEQTLREVTNAMQKNVSEQMKEHMSQLLSEITDGHYSKIFMQGRDEIVLYEKERRIGLYRLSRGTVEQIYLALRLAAADCVMGYEKLPLIFDETFVYYDEERLRRTLEVLAAQPRQILLFTCHHREGELLTDMQKGYKSIKLTE